MKNPTLAMLGFLLIGVCLVPRADGAPSAAGAAHLSRLEISLWPEYDRSAVLVIYRGHLPSSTTLPSEVRLPVPAGAGEPTAVAKRGADGELYLTPFTRTLAGDSAWLTFTIDAPDLQIEFYAPLDTSTPKRTFSLRWPGEVEVDALALEVQQPAGVGDLTTSMTTLERAVAEDGLTYAHGSLGALAAKDKPVWQFAYTKNTTTLTAATQPSQGDDSLFEDDEQGTCPLEEAQKAGGTAQGAASAMAAGSTAAPREVSASPSTTAVGSARLWIMGALAVGLALFIGLMLGRATRG